MENRSYRIEVVSNRERLKSIGPLIPGAWSRHDDELGREARGEFLIDTGAYGAMIDYDVAVSLQLREQGTRKFTAFTATARCSSISPGCACRPRLRAALTIVSNRS